MIKLLFCQDPLADKQADALYLHEATVAQALGIAHHLLDYAALEKGNVARAVRFVPTARQETLAIYRGWALTPRLYDLLVEALLSRGLRLINTADAYLQTLYLPELLDVIREDTPRTVWFRTDGNISYTMVMSLLLPFNGQSVIVRDFARSRKNNWSEACFIPDSADREQVEAVVRRFVALQGQIQGGLVFREYVPLKPLTTHMPGQMPLALEFRVFYLDGAPIATTHYWDVPDYNDVVPPLAQFADIAAAIPSRFFTMDVAQTEDDRWLILDIGDAQVASLPASANTAAFYQAIARYGNALSSQ